MKENQSGNNNDHQEDHVTHALRVAVNQAMRSVLDGAKSPDLIKEIVKSALSLENLVQLIAVQDISKDAANRTDFAKQFKGEQQ